MTKNLTISSAPYRAHGERIIPFEGPIVPLLGGPCAPVAIYAPRWEARAKDEDGKPYIVIWETDSDTFDPEPDPDYVLKYDPCHRRFCYSDPKKYVIRK